MFGMSFVYVIFEDGTDIYWARSRVLEYLNFVRYSCPGGSAPPSGPMPPASAGFTSTAWSTTAASTTWPNCGASRTGTCGMSSAVPGVAEVASVGGFEKQYQVVIDPQHACSPTVSRWPRSGGHQAVQQRRRRRGHRGGPRPNTWCAAAATSRASRRRKHRGGDGPQGHARCCSRMWPGAPGPEMRRGIADSTARARRSAASSCMRFGENARTSSTASRQSWRS